MRLGLIKIIGLSFETISRSMVIFCCVLFLFSINIPVANSAICFLPDCEDRKVNEGGDTGAEACLNAGYESDKSLLCHEYSIIKYCPQNSNYIKCDDAQWCMINGYIETECEPPYELFNKCPNGQEMYKECKLSMEDVCKAENENYVDLCPAGWTLDPNNLCSYSDEWGECCNMCPGFEYTSETLPPGAQAAASCKSCDGMRYIISNIGDICEGFWDCQDGCEIGSETCMAYNGNIKCKTCKRCEAKCSNETCPYGAICEYENCTQRYCDPTGCKIGYTHLCTPLETRDCAALGYDTPKASCEGMDMIECPFDNSKVWCIPDDGSCCSSRCDGYDYEFSEIPEGYRPGASCKCCGKTLYKIEKGNCDGFIKSSACPYGGADGTEVCKSGDATFYKECKVCPNACAHKVCPAGSICTQEPCSKTFCVTGCSTNYADYCTVPIQDCAALGYKSISGDCLDGRMMRCPYDQNKVFCLTRDSSFCPDHCTGYDYKLSEIPAGYVAADSCTACLQTRYKIKLNTCDGFIPSKQCDFGPADGTQSCRSGAETFYQQCKECDDPCPYRSCPAGTICTQEACSKTYCPTGCATNYKNFCDTPTKDCDALGYRYLTSDCSNKAVLKCPYDQSKVFCK